jgi:hypothetical protein
MGPTDPSSNFSSSGERSQGKRRKVSAVQRNVPADPPASLLVARGSDTGHRTGFPADERELSHGSGADDADNGSKEGMTDEGEEMEKANLDDERVSGGGSKPKYPTCLGF